MANFNTNLPSVRIVQNFIKDKQLIEIKLVTGDVITGEARWQDDDCIAVTESNNQQIVLWRNAIAYLKAKS